MAMPCSFSLDSSELRVTSFNVFVIRVMILTMIIMGAAECALGQSLAKRKLNAIAGKVFFTSDQDGTYSLRNWVLSEDSTRQDNPRLVAIALDITLGVLGMHRLYLGTNLKVPIFYTLTLGGGGVLWLVDLGFLIASRDIGPFLDNPKLFMWAE
jgi:hypothetical protein